jgi:flavin-dependent dehydrogenase
MTDYDIAVAGAGPAGSVLALLAARAGRRVLLVERSHFTRPRFGETAPPELGAALEKIGLGHLRHQPYAIAVPQVMTVWGDDRPAAQHHIASPYGPALHLDRRAFDEAIALAARDAGADLRLGSAARLTPSRRGWVVEIRGGARADAGVAILAHGRTGGRIGLPYVRRYLDDHVGLAASFPLPESRPALGTLIETAPGGWFYLAALPSQSLLVVLMTSARLVPTRSGERLRWWLETLAQTRMIRSAVRGCRIPQALSVVDARASCAEVGAGEHWFAIGDARIAPDPLSGQGILWAIDDAVTVMGLAERLEWREVAGQMQARTAGDVALYQADRQLVYARETRFAADPYWKNALHFGGAAPWSADNRRKSSTTNRNFSQFA